MEIVAITEGITSSIGAADVQATYYALQKQLNAPWAVNRSVAIFLPLLLFFSGLGARIYDLLLRRLKFWSLAAFAFLLRDCVPARGGYRYG